MTQKKLDLNDQAVVDRLHELDLQFADVLSRELPVDWSTKEDSKLMKWIAVGLDAAMDIKTLARTVGVDIPLKAPDGALFLGSFATTIKQTVYIPRAWMQPTAFGVRARWRVRAHEWQHALQDSNGVARMPGWPKALQHSVLYLAGCIAHTSDGEEYLAKVEGDAYGVTNYSVSLFSGEAPPPMEESLDSLRSSYNLLGHGPAHAEDILRSHYGSMRVGGIPPVTAAMKLRDFLLSHGSDVRGRVQL